MELDERVRKLEERVFKLTAKSNALDFSNAILVNYLHNHVDSFNLENVARLVETVHDGKTMVSELNPVEHDALLDEEITALNRIAHNIRNMPLDTTRRL